MVPTDRCPYELAAFCPQRELTKATSELGEVRMTVCRSTLASDRGEMDSARFLLNFSMERGVEKQDAVGQREKERSHSAQFIFGLSSTL